MANDLGQMAQRIAQSLHEPSSGEFLTEAKLAIIDAIGQLENEEWPWNKGEFTFETVADTRTYDLSTEVGTGARYIVPPVFCELDQDDENVVELTHLSHEDYERQRAGWEDTGDPLYWAFRGETIFLLPIPDGVHNIRGRFIKKVTKPTATWNGSAWTFSADSTADEWFEAENGEELVRTLACHLLCSGYLERPQAAQMWMLRHQQAQARVLGLNEEREPVGSPQLDWYL